MLTEQGTMFTEVVFNDTKTERFLLRKIWDESKPVACLIMSNPSTANVVTIDMTTHYTICNLFKLGYGGVEILNMTSTITTKLDTKHGVALFDENAEFILKSAENAEKVIIAWGVCGEGNRKIQEIQRKLLKKLEPFADKLFVIASDKGESGFHPLAPQIRFSWELIPFVCPAYLKDKSEIKPEKQPQDEQEEALELGAVFNAPGGSEGQPTELTEKPTKGRKGRKATVKIA
jgi:hypothetical protein